VRKDSAASRQARGNNLATHLISKGWDVYGLARKPHTGIAAVRPVAADLLEPKSLQIALAGINPTHVFIATWLRQATEAQNCAVNGAMVRNLLAAVESCDRLRHVALVTGLKHYVGPFEAYAKEKPYYLAETDLGRPTSAWHTDMDLGREIEVVTDMTKSRLAGFLDYQPTLNSFLDLFARWRADRIIPA
jgi:NAD dependent epimerase/dehydratase family